MRLVDATDPVFARHETFHPRYSWFRKAFATTVEDPYIFTREDATVRIGVGKNMVKAIRFWGLAAKLITERKQNTRSQLEPTSFGHALFGDYGSDRYLEDPNTLWLLHWLLLAPRSKVPVWWIAFNEFNAVEFSEIELESPITAYLQATPDFPEPSQSSISKDISALLRTYSTTRQKQPKFDDVFDCPLRELNLISYSDSSKKYRFNLGTKFSMNPEILVFSILNYMARTESSAKSILISRLAHESGAPGKVFKLAEKEIIDKLELVTPNFEELDLNTVAGASQLSWSGSPIDIANDVLSTYYFSNSTQKFEYDCEQSIRDTTIN